MLRAEAMQKSFDGFQAVKNAHLEVEKGEVVAVIGPNGAGKTTLFNLIGGQIKPDGGRVIFKDEEITALPPHGICRRGITRSFQVVNIFNRLSVFENVQIAVLSQQQKTFKLLTSASRLALEETMAILESVGLAPKADHISGALAHGDQKVLEMAIALGCRPELLILDEPTAGMSPEETAVTLGLMKRLSEELGLTILFCEHDMELVFAIAHEIMVMHQGETLIQAGADAVRNDTQVIEAYLGETQ